MSSIGTGVRRPRPRKQRRHSRLARHSHWDSGLTAAPLPASQYDLYTTSYSPDGRVFQVEYANKAVESSGLVPAPHPIQLPWHRSFSPRQSSSSCTFGAMPVSKHQLGRRSSRNIRGISVKRPCAAFPRRSVMAVGRCWRPHSWTARSFKKLHLSFHGVVWDGVYTPVRWVQGPKRASEAWPSILGASCSASRFSPSHSLLSSPSPSCFVSFRD